MNRPLVPFIPVFTKVVPIVPNISSNIAGRRLRKNYGYGIHSDV